jgi:hypothetical protein
MRRGRRNKKPLEHFHPEQIRLKGLGEMIVHGYPRLASRPPVVALP